MGRGAKLAMNTNLKALAWFIGLAVIFILNPVMPIQAEEVDLSCTKHRVRSKIAVSDRFREFDVIIENRCPGPVYWSTCIERMDPWTNKTLETFTPSGQLQAEKKTRVNLRMKRVTEDSDPRLVFEEFYLSVGLDLKPTLKAQCVAKACESKKIELRTASRANEKARQKLVTALEARIAGECPQSGWGGKDQAECEEGIHQASQAELDQIAQKQQELKDQLAAVDPEQCQVYGGN